MRNISAKMPIATVGMPASTSSTGLMTLRTFGLMHIRRGRLQRARPTGTAISMPQKVVLMVPTTIGRTPKVGSANVGAHLVPKRKSPTGTSPKNSMVGTSSEMTIAMVVTTEMKAHSARLTLISFSP